MTGEKSTKRVANDTEAGHLPWWASFFYCSNVIVNLKKRAWIIRRCGKLTIQLVSTHLSHDSLCAPVHTVIRMISSIRLGQQKHQFGSVTTLSIPHVRLLKYLGQPFELCRVPPHSIHQRTEVDTAARWIQVRMIQCSRFR